MTQPTPSPPTRRRGVLSVVLPILVLSALGGGIGYVSAMLTDEKWLVSAKVLLQIGPETAGSRPSMVGSPAPFLTGNPRREDVQTEVELLSSPDILRRTFDRLFQEDPDGALGREPSKVTRALRETGEGLGLMHPRARAERALDKWASNLRIAVVPSSTVLEIQARSDRPKAAARFLEILLDLYREDHLKAFGAQGLPTVLSGYVADRERALAAAESALTKLRTDLGVVDVVQETGLLLRRRSEADTALRDLVGKVEGVRAKVRALEVALESIPAEHRLSSERRPNPNRDELDLRLVTARQNLTVAEQQYQEDSPEVRVAREVVTLLSELAAKAASDREAGAVAGRNTVHDTIHEALLQARAEDRSLEAQRAAAEATATALQKRLAEIERGRAALQKAEIDVDEAKKAVTQANEGARLARIEGVLDEHKVANVTVVTPPTWLPTPLRTFGLPTRVAISAGGLLAGFGLGVVWVLWRRSARPAPSAPPAGPARGMAGGGGP